MGIEELKVIMNALSGMGAEAKEAFIWYLVLAKLLPTALIAVVWLAFFGAMVYIATKTIKTVLLQNETCHAFLALGKVIGLIPEGDSYVTRAEVSRIGNEMIKFVNEHKGR